MSAQLQPSLLLLSGEKMREDGSHVTLMSHINEIAGIPIPTYIDSPETEEPAVVAAIEAEIAADALGPIGFSQEELANINQELSQHIEPDLPKGADTQILGADIPEDPLEPVGFTQEDLENIAQYISSP